MNTSKDSKGVQTIQRAISLLRGVANHNDQGISLSNIARQSGLNVATTHRILSILVQEGLISRDPVSKLYHLDLELYLLGETAYQYSIRNQLRALIERIATESEDTVFLLIRSGNDALCIDRVEGKFPIRTVPIDIGARRPLGIGAGSLALIAFLPSDQLEAILAANASRYSQYRNITAGAIRNLAVLSRKAGYVVSEEVFHEGVLSIGIPIFNRQKGVIAAITVSSIFQRMDGKRLLEIVRLTRDAMRSEDINIITQIKKSSKTGSRKH